MTETTKLETEDGGRVASNAGLDRDAIIRALLEIAQAAFFLMDDCCEEQTEDGSTFTVDKTNVEVLSAALDKLDELLDDKPGYTMDGPGRAQWALLGV